MVYGQVLDLALSIARDTSLVPSISYMIASIARELLTWCTEAYRSYPNSKEGIRFSIYKLLQGVSCGCDVY